jgi:hypothetical protein
MEFEYLDPKTTLFEQAPDGTLRVIVPEVKCAIRVEPLRAFPLSHPEEQIVLRDGKNKEVGTLEKLSDVPEPAQSWLREGLHRRYFLPRIIGIRDITERFGSSVWVLETDRGSHTVTTGQMNEAVHEVEPGRYLLTDVEGNRFEIRSLKELDADSRARFQGKI